MQLPNIQIYITKTIKVFRNYFSYYLFTSAICILCIAQSIEILPSALMFCKHWRSKWRGQCVAVANYYSKSMTKWTVTIFEFLLFSQKTVSTERGERKMKTFLIFSTFLREKRSSNAGPKKSTCGFWSKRFCSLGETILCLH